MELPDPQQSSFDLIDSVPGGSVVELERHSRRTFAWCDPLSVVSIRFNRDEDYVEAARSHLSEAVRHALEPARKPGVTLSGGLDSALVCDEIDRQLPAGQRLTSYTFEPIREWDGTVPAHKFGTDRPLVEQFAALHPRIDPVFVDNRGINFDHCAEEIFTASDAGYPARTMGTLFHGIYEAAHRDGCDWLLFAHGGNMTFSQTAPWAEAEFLRHGRMKSLWQLLAKRPEDGRPMIRRLASRSVMPNLPGRLRRAISRSLHRSRTSDPFANPFLAAEGRLGAFRWESSISRNIMSVDKIRSRESYILSNYHTMGLGAEVELGYEQVFAVRPRDVTLYRPLVEFCFGLPTEQFVHDGERRWLARRMAIGRLP